MSKIGVVYTCTTTNFNESYFLPQYHRPGVRDEVRMGLELMANAGVEVINTRLFVGAPEADFESQKHKWMIGFPPRFQDLANLTRYVNDVREAGLTLDIWLQKVGDCDPERGMVVVDNYGPHTPDRMEPHLGWGEHPLDEYRRLMKQTIHAIIGAVPSGAVRLWSFNGDSVHHLEPHTIASHSLRKRLLNRNWMFEEFFGLFAYLLHRDQKGQATLECVTTKNRAGNGDPNDEGWQSRGDNMYPQTEGHRTMWWPFRTMSFVFDCFARKGWPMDKWLAPWLLLDCYVDAGRPEGVEPWVARIVDDYRQAFRPEFPMLENLGFTETSFFGNPAMRMAHARAMDDPAIKTFALWSPNYRPHRIDTGHTPRTPIVEVDMYR